MKQSQNTELLIVFFEEKNDLQPFYDELETINDAYPNAIINQITLAGNFSRGKALDTATRSRFISPKDIIFFVDVDIIFQEESLNRIRINTIENKQVYLPIVFSQYDPNRISRTNISYTNQYTSGDVAYETGYFRQFGYGICAIYKSDIMNPHINGFNTDITGWGLEDVKFLEQIIKLNQKPHAMLLNTADTPSALDPLVNMGFIQSHEKTLRLSVFRAPDPSLVHVFHPIECDRNLEESQYLMCIGTKANTFGSYKQIESVLLSNKSIIEYFSVVNSVK